MKISIGDVVVGPDTPYWREALEQQRSAGFAGWKVRDVGYGIGGVDRMLVGETYMGRVATLGPGEEPNLIQISNPDFLGTRSWYRLSDFRVVSERSGR